MRSGTHVATIGPRTYAEWVKWWIAGAGLALALAGCGSPPSTLSPADNITIDCNAAAQAIADYSDAFSSLLTALEGDDASTAGAVAPTFGVAARTIIDQLPGVPPEAQSFVTTSQSFAERVRDVVSGNGDLLPVAEEARTEFGTSEFTGSVAAVEAFFRQSCPTTIIPTPSASPA